MKWLCAERVNWKGLKQPTRGKEIGNRISLSVDISRKELFTSNEQDIANKKSALPLPYVGHIDYAYPVSSLKLVFEILTYSL